MGKTNKKHPLTFFREKNEKREGQLKKYQGVVSGSEIMNSIGAYADSNSLVTGKYRPSNKPVDPNKIVNNGPYIPTPIEGEPVQNLPYYQNRKPNSFFEKWFKKNRKD